jgi:hypothetical protein
VIEGEGLGGFARRLTINGNAGGLFRPRVIFFFALIFVLVFVMAFAAIARRIDARRRRRFRDRRPRVPVPGSGPSSIRRPPGRTINRENTCRCRSLSPSQAIVRPSITKVLPIGSRFGKRLNLWRTDNGMSPLQWNRVANAAYSAEVPIFP